MMSGKTKKTKTRFGAYALMTAILFASPTWSQTGDDCVSPAADIQTPDFDLLPADLPGAIRVGEDWLVRLSPTAGCDAGTCDVQWTSDRPDVATWLKSAPPCGKDECAILEPLASGTVRLTARLCDEQSCQTKSFDLHVIR